MQEHSKTKEETTKTKITIKNNILYIAVIISVMAAFLQLFISEPQEIDLARKENIKFRKERDKIRDQIFLLTDQYTNGELSDQTYKNQILSLRDDYKRKEKQSNEAFTYLNKTKASYAVMGFKHRNSFAAGLGLPLFIISIATILYIFSLYLIRTYKKDNLGISLQRVAQACFIVGLTYLSWVLYPENDLATSIYFIFWIMTAYIAYRIITQKIYHIYGVNYTGNLKKVISRLFDFIIIDINDGFIKSEQKSAYVEAYHQEIATVTELIESESETKA